MADTGGEAPKAPQPSPSGSRSENRMGFLRGRVKAKQKEQKAGIAKRGGPDLPERVFLDTAISAVRADLRSQYDSKTELLNYESIMTAARREIDVVIRNPNVHGLIAGRSDLDEFGSINPNFGLDKGHELIRAAAEATIAVVRTTDYVGREGGEENLIVLPFDKENDPFAYHHPNKPVEPTDLDGKEIPGERIRMNINTIPHPSGKGNISASIGMVEYVPQEDPKIYEGLTAQEKRVVLDRELKETLRVVDHALQVAKLTGKNKTVIAKRDPQEGWIYHDVTNGNIYTAQFTEPEINEENGKEIPPKMISLVDITKGKDKISYTVDNSGKKPVLIKPELAQAA